MMVVTLPPELEQFVQEQVDRGNFSTREEVVWEALRLFQRGEEGERSRLEDLRRFVAVGLEQAERGEVAPLDMAAIRAEGRRRLAQREEGEELAHALRTPDSPGGAGSA